MTFTEAFLIANPDWAEILADEPKQGQLTIDYD
jgi:hypothetical protein